MCVCVRVCIYINVCVYIYICIYKYVYTLYIYTYTCIDVGFYTAKGLFVQAEEPRHDNGPRPFVLGCIVPLK